MIYKKAREFPDVPIILGHLSTGPRSSHEAAIDIMVESIEQDTATLYVDISWVEIEDIILLIERLKNTKKVIIHIVLCGLLMRQSVILIRKKRFTPRI